MAYTSHGHHIPGSPTSDDKPVFVARCGGPKLCDTCGRDMSRYNHPSNFTKKPSEIMRYFEYSHLPMELATISQGFADLARKMDHFLPNGPEKSVALRKLLEGKDAAVRAAL